MTNEELQKIDISNLRFYARMASEFKWGTDVLHFGAIVSTLDAIADRLGAAVSASPQPSVDIKQKCINFICKNPYPAWDQLVELVESCFAAAPAQERDWLEFGPNTPPRNGMYRVRISSKDKTTAEWINGKWLWDACEGEPITDLTSQVTHYRAAQEQPVENSPIVTIKLMRDGSMDMNLPTEALAGLPEVLEEAAAKLRRELAENSPRDSLKDFSVAKVLEGFSKEPPHPTVFSPQKGKP